MSIFTVLGILFVKVTKPYWILVTAKTSTYLSVGPTIRKLYKDLQACIEDPSLLLSSEQLPAFSLSSSFSCKFNLDPPREENENSILCIILKELSAALVKTMKKQLQDFIERREESDTDVASTSFALATNLLCERNFGDLDASQHRRPSASIHHHTSIHFLKCLPIDSCYHLSHQKKVKIFGGKHAKQHHF